MPLTANYNLSLKNPLRKLVFSACLHFTEIFFFPSVSFSVGKVWKSENPLAKNLLKRRVGSGSDENISFAIFEWKANSFYSTSATWSCRQIWGSPWDAQIELTLWRSAPVFSPSWGFASCNVVDYSLKWIYAGSKRKAFGLKIHRHKAFNQTTKGNSGLGRNVQG